MIEPALTEIEIALRKEENPSENVQWAIERLNKFQEHYEESLNICIAGERASEREDVVKKLIKHLKEYGLIAPEKLAVDVLLKAIGE